MLCNYCALQCKKEEPLTELHVEAVHQPFIWHDLYLSQGHEYFISFLRSVTRFNPHHFWLNFLYHPTYPSSTFALSRTSHSEILFLIYH